MRLNREWKEITTIASKDKDIYLQKYKAENKIDLIFLKSEKISSKKGSEGIGSSIYECKKEKCKFQIRFSKILNEFKIEASEEHHHEESIQSFFFI